MPYLLFAQTLKIIKQVNAFDFNIATLIIITGKERKNKKNIFQLFNFYTLIFTASYNINNILPDL